MSHIKYWVGFSMISGIGQVKFRRIMDYFGDLEEAWHAGRSDLRAAGLEDGLVSSILNRRRNIDLDTEMEKLERFGVCVLTQNDPSFPPRLKEIYDAPYLLYVKGELKACDESAITVVGTRRPSMYGREVTERLVADLVQNGMTIVSGLARGIDTIAHRKALAAEGRTIAVFGCGLDTIYPAENRELSQEITEHGALVSDYPLGIKPKAENFPRRNRIISGLSLGTLVTEASERSGALITANLALQQDREVFAVPGSIFSTASSGTNSLIKAGAKLVSDVNDILEELNLSTYPRQMELTELVPESDTESLLLKHLSQEPLHVDELAYRSSLPVSVVSSTLTMMELKGMVNHLGNMNYVIARGVKAS